MPEPQLLPTQMRNWKASGLFTQFVMHWRGPVPPAMQVPKQVMSLMQSGELKHDCS